MKQIREPGVYRIRNIINGKVYIGSASEIAARWRVHKNRLRAGKHHSPHLQSAWKMYGENFFEFEVLETCPVEVSRERESELIKEARSFIPEFGYNVITDPMYPSPTKESIEKNRQAHLGKKHSKETIEKIRLGNSGKIVAEETRKKISQALQGKSRPKSVIEKVSNSILGKYERNPSYSEEQLRELLIGFKEKKSRKQISKDSGIPIHKIYAVKYGWVKHLAPAVTRIKQELGMQ